MVDIGRDYVSACSVCSAGHAGDRRSGFIQVHGVDGNAEETHSMHGKSPFCATKNGPTTLAGNITPLGPTCGVVRRVPNGGKTSRRLCHRVPTDATDKPSRMHGNDREK